MITPTNPGPSDPFAHVPEFALRLFRTEPLARTVRRWHELRIPGVFQSPEFTTAAHRVHDERDPLPFTAEEAVALREERRTALSSTFLDSCQVILYEEALHRIAASLGAGVARAQAQFLAEVVDGSASWCDSRTTLAILPRTSPMLFAPGDLTLLTFAPDAGEQDYLYIEQEFGVTGGVGANYLTESTLLAKADKKWAQLTEDGLPDPDKTLELLNQLPQPLV
jgi:hypothetical protein